MSATAANNTAIKKIDPATLRMERLLPGSPERVWSYLTDGDKRRQWFSGGTSITGVGQTATLHFRHKDFADTPAPERWKEMDQEGFRSEVEVLTFDPPKRLSYTWPEGDNVSEVTFELTPEGKDTRLVLTHRRIGSINYMVSFASGWHSHFDALVQVLNGEKPKGFWASVVKLEEKYRAAFGA